MAALNLNDIMRYNAYDLRKKLCEHDLSTSGTRWVHAVRLALFSDFSILTSCPTLTRLTKEALQLPAAMAVPEQPGEAGAPAQQQLVQQLQQLDQHLPQQADQQLQEPHELQQPDEHLERQPNQQLEEPHEQLQQLVDVMPEQQKAAGPCSRYKLRPSLGSTSNNSEPSRSVSEDVEDCICCSRAPCICTKYLGFSMVPLRFDIRISVKQCV